MMSSTAPQVRLAISRQACRCSLALAALVFLAIAPANSQVKLNPAAAPSAGQPGVQVIKVTGSGFPGGTIPAQNVTVSLDPAVPNTGPSGTATATAVTLFFGTIRSVSFQIPAAVATQAPTAYKVSISGTTSGGVHFSSSTSSSLTINPPASVGFSPGVGDRGQSLTVMITGNFTNFLTGSTQANFGADISVGGAPAGHYGPVTVTSSTLASASLVISPSANLGSVQATVATGVQTANAYFAVREVPFSVRNYGGKCLDYGTSPSGNRASVFLNDCSLAHSIRFVEIDKRMDSQGNAFSHEVLLFAGTLVIGIHREITITQGGSAPAPAPPATEYSLELQKPYYSILGAGLSNPADQIFRLDGDSIILEGTPDQPTPCLNTDTYLCPSPPPPQLVMQIQNARGANGSPIEVGLRHLADNEFWDINPVDGSGRFPTGGFKSVTTHYEFWNTICADPVAVVTNSVIYPPSGTCARFNAGWGSVIVINPQYECYVEGALDSACIDLSSFPPLTLPAGITVRGYRRGILFGPELHGTYNAEFPSQGLCPACMLEIHGDYVRVTALRLRGQDRTTDQIALDTVAIAVDFVGPPNGAPLFSDVTLTQFIATIDHNDISDWEEAAVALYTPYHFAESLGNTVCWFNGYVSPPTNTYACGDSVPDPSNRFMVPITDDPATLANVHVARNFLHHNERDSGGYGVEVGRAFIEGNTFLMNRHQITSGGEPHNEYRAANNLVLSNAPDYQECFLGICATIHNQDFDMHGTDNPGHWFGGQAGFYVDILKNTFLGTNRANYWLRGDPVYYTDFHRNVSLQDQGGTVRFDRCRPHTVCIGGGPDPINIFDNQFQANNPTDHLRVGDFDGDGVQDLFLATGNTWFYSPGGAREWRYLNAAPDTIDQLLFGDFDGDGRTDVVAMRNGQLVVSWGGISAFDVLNPNPPANCAITDMAVGDFNGDGHPDIFCADWRNKLWWISYSGNTPFVQVNSSSFQRKDLLFADFDGDGATDVFGVVSNGSFGTWSYSKSATGSWADGYLRPALTNSVDGLVAADFNGDGFADIGMLCSNKGWEISYGGTSGWSNCSTLASLSPVDGGVGHFSGGAGADLLLWNGNEFWVVAGGTGLPRALSTQDMR